MKSKVISTIICMSVILTSVVYATNVTSPGSSSDPVVSKSYVDELIGDTLEKILNLDNTYNELKLRVDALEQAVKNGVSSNESSNQGNSNDSEVIKVTENYTFKPIELSSNQLLLGGEGCELIVRSGSAIGYTEVANGLTNITNGSEILNGEEIPLNNVLIVPRNDNRGILVNSNQTWIMIRGDYTIINR